MFSPPFFRRRSSHTSKPSTDRRESTCSELKKRVTSSELRVCFLSSKLALIDAIVPRHRRHRFSVILCDLSMPVLDGFGATQKIREIEKARRTSSSSPTLPPSRVTILALTGLATPEDKRRAFGSGVDGYLVKPVSLKTLDSVFKSERTSRLVGLIEDQQADSLSLRFLCRTWLRSLIHLFSLSPCTISSISNLPYVLSLSHTTQFSCFVLLALCLSIFFHSINSRSCHTSPSFILKLL